MPNSNLKRTRVIDILDQVSVPAAPFYERLVADQILRIVEPLLPHPNVSSRTDGYGNLMVEWRNAKKPLMPCLALAAHMDHPGYDILESDGKRAKAQIMGGLYTDEKLINSGILIVAGDTEVQGIITAVTSGGEETGGRKITYADIELDTPLPGSCEFYFGVPDVERFRIDGELIRGRAMDDLVGCAIQLAVFESIVSDEVPVDCILVFHRAEEVGFLGAIGSCESQTIPQEALLVSIEASKHLEGARPGDGIVLRTGDRLYQYDPNAMKVLEAAAEKVAANGIRTQQKCMDGGVSEATPYLSFGYETTGLAVPLINYHNQGEGKVEAEAVNGRDLDSGVAVLREVAIALPETHRIPSARFRQRCRERFFEYADRLKRTEKGC